MLLHLLSRLNGAVVAIQFRELLALEAASLPDAVRFVVFDGEEALCCVRGDGSQVPLSERPEWMDRVEVRGGEDRDDVESFISNVLRLKKRQVAEIPDFCSDKAAGASSIAFVDETSNDCLFLTRGRKDTVRHERFDEAVLRYEAPLELGSDAQVAATCALVRVEEGLAVKVYS